MQTQDSVSSAVSVDTAVAINAALTEMSKRMVARPRPYTSEAFEAKYPDVYNSEDMLVLRENNDTKVSSVDIPPMPRATYFTSAALIAAHYDDPQWMRSVMQRLLSSLAYGIL